MTDLAEYTVLVQGIPHTMLLSEEDARARGVFVEPGVAAEKPKRKSK